LNDLIKTHENKNGELLQAAISRFNENPENFLLVEGMKIFTETDDPKTKLDALVFLESVWPW
jgi:hypothetical protein